MTAVARHLTRTLLELKEERRVDSATRHFGIARPAHFESWSAGGPEGASEGPDADRPSDRCLEAYVSKRAWVAPESPICFLTDLHADREAFWRSLLVAGLIELDEARFGRNGSTTLESVPDEAFSLTDFGRETHYVVGGDLFDKGPANLPLLDALSSFRDRGARFTLLAGNHDVRTFLGIRFAESFELYNGPLGNMFRTKYRDLDLPFAGRGLRQLHRIGIHAIVHGHRNVFLGQHMNFRRGMLNFACDACIDRNTRQIESLPGDGSAATIIAEDGTIYAARRKKLGFRHRR